MKTKPLAFGYIGYDASSADTQNATSKQANHQPQGIQNRCLKLQKNCIQKRELLCTTLWPVTGLF